MIFSNLLLSHKCEKAMVFLVRVTIVIFCFAVFGNIAMLFLSFGGPCIDFYEFLINSIFFVLMSGLILKFFWIILKSKMLVKKSKRLRKGIDKIY